MGRETNPFEDVKESDWYFDAILEMYKRGLMQGMQPNLFGPTVPLVRAQVVVVLYRLAGCPEVIYKPVFPDVPQDMFFSNAVVWAYQNGIVTGHTGPGIFAPLDEITREQLATMLYRYAKYKGLDMNIEGPGIESYPDRRLVSAYAREPMSWCVDKGIMTGDKETELLLPLKKTVRAICAVSVGRLLKLYNQ